MNGVKYSTRNKMLFNLFSVLETIHSPANGEIKIVKDLQGVRIIVGGISQSGWLVRKVWNTGVSKAAKEMPIPKDVLILGLGGGSAVEVVAKHWSQAKIIGLDIDPKMVEMGKKYLGLDKFEQLKVVIADAKAWTKGQKAQQYDAILVDLFKGVNIPEFFTSETFLKEIKRLVKDDGVALFNHLYSNLEKEDAEILQKKLEKIFKKVVTVRPEANIIFLCYKQ